MKHSRAFEREADDYARQMLARMGIPSQGFIAILERLSEANDGDSDDGFGPYFSTHPGIEERVERLEAGGR